MNKDLMDWRDQKSSDDALILTDMQDTGSNERKFIQTLTESAPSLMTMTAEFDQDPNHVTPGGTKSNESFGSDRNSRDVEGGDSSRPGQNSGTYL